MKKFLCLILVSVLAMSVFSACGNKNDTVPDDVPAQAEKKTDAEPADKTSGNASSSEDTPSTDDKSSSSDSKATTDDTTPDVYLAIDATDNDVKISYHLEGCSATKGLTTQKIEWDMVQTLGFRQCQTCKPPKYEGYIE